METTVINATEYRDLPLSQLNESKTNPRRVFDETALQELASSIRSQGVLSPLLVRPLTENGFEIVAGARRYRAAQMAEVATVPVRIVNLSDAEALAAQLVENLIRAEIHPMEEAEGFARLLTLDEPKYSIEQIAARVGKQPFFVASRIRLIDLAPTAVEAFYANEIGVGHALLLAKLPADQQEQALSACFKEVYNGEHKPARILLPVRNLQFWIESNVLLVLKDAPFDKRDGQLVPTAGSCADCSKRTGHNKLLFGDDLGRQGDRCKLCGIWANCKSLLLSFRRRANCLRRGFALLCSPGISERRSTCLVTSLSTLSAGIGVRWLQPIPMPAPGSCSSHIAVWHTTRSTPIHAPWNAT